MLRGIPKHSIQSLKHRSANLLPHFPPSRFYTKYGMASEHFHAGPKALRHPYKEPLPSRSNNHRGKAKARESGAGGRWMEIIFLSPVPYSVCTKL